MILVGIGSNLPLHAAGTPLASCKAALSALAASGIAVRALSGWYRTAPVPVSDQPWFVNAVAEVETALSAIDLLEVLHRIEADLGRVRSVPNAARVIDLDLLDVDGAVTSPEARPALPHPRLADRAFVLLPLRDVAPGWRHPVTRRTIDALIEALPVGQGIERMEDAGFAG